MEIKDYRQRVADSVIAEVMEGKGAVLVEGPKWCGKTTTCAHLAKSVVSMDEPRRRERNVLLAKVDPDKLLEGEHPLLIDEWQIAPTLWDAVRYKVDRENGFGHYLLTGSSVPPRTDEINHTGTGRIARVRMRPMSLWESGESSGSVSLSRLFAGETFKAVEAHESSLEEIAFAACRGGWPAVIGLRERVALRQAFDYVDAVVQSDISRFDGVSRDPERARRLMRSYARLQGSAATWGVIADDLSAHEGSAFGENTAYAYLNALRGIFVVEDMPAWHPNLRRKTTIRTSDVRYFSDPSIVAASLRIGPNDLMDDLATFGLVFETMAVRDLRVYAEALDGDVFHFLDRNGLECDAVVHLRDGRYGLIEVKIGGDALVEKGCASLRRLRDALDTEKMREPSFMMVLTAVGDFAYRRPDDVIVCPIGALRP